MEGRFDYEKRSSREIAGNSSFFTVVENHAKFPSLLLGTIPKIFSGTFFRENLFSREFILAVFLAEKRSVYNKIILCVLAFYII